MLLGIGYILFLDLNFTLIIAALTWLAGLNLNLKIKRLGDRSKSLNVLTFGLKNFKKKKKHLRPRRNKS